MLNVVICVLAMYQWCQHAARPSDFHQSFWREKMKMGQRCSTEQADDELMTIHFLDMGR